MDSSKKNKKRIFLKYHRRDLLRRGWNKAMKKLHIRSHIQPRYASTHRWLTDAESQELISRYILENRPSLISRFGGTETRCTAEAIAVEVGARKHLSEKTMEKIQILSGVFPRTEEFLLHYGTISKESAKNVDILGVWDSQMQDYLIDTLCGEHTFLAGVGNLEPYYREHPWSAALKGKKVLVIHPFAKSIYDQYTKKRALLFPDRDVLPEFELSVLPAVQTIAGSEDNRFENWEQALEYMYQEAIKIDFDVAILGCGAYGMPLGSKLKDYGKVCIHMGGATQLLFGIKGARWDHDPVVSGMYNDAWVRPSEEETPKNVGRVENACYW